MKAYRETLTHRGFLLSSLGGAFNFTALFVYIAGAPAFLLQHLRVRETEFFWLFGPVTAGMMLGSAVSGRVAGRMDTRHTLAWAYFAMISATLANIALHSARAASLPWSVLPLFFYAIGMSLSLPTLTLIGLDFFPTHRGLASSCQAFMLTAGNAIVAGLIVPFASKSPLLLALTSGALMLLGLASVRLMRRAAG